MHVVVVQLFRALLKFSGDQSTKQTMLNLTNSPRFTKELLYGTPIVWQTQCIVQTMLPVMVVLVRWHLR